MNARLELLKAMGLVIVDRIAPADVMLAEPGVNDFQPFRSAILAHVPIEWIEDHGFNWGAGKVKTELIRQLCMDVQRDRKGHRVCWRVRPEIVMERGFDAYVLRIKAFARGVIVRDGVEMPKERAVEDPDGWAVAGFGLAQVRSS